MPKPALPNLIIAGVNKAGTTSIFSYLSAHPEVSPSRVKETQYFLPLRYGDHDLPGIDHYLQFFDPMRNTKYCMEATAGYFYGGRQVAETIDRTLSDVRIVLIFREPISRLFSFYRFKKNSLELDETVTFEEYVEKCESLPKNERMKRENNLWWGIEGGFYSDYLDDWFDVFGDDAIQILFFESLKKDTRGLLSELCLWLDIEQKTFVKNLDLSIENKSVNYRYQTLQRMALSINWRGEEFWRSHPIVKKQLRKLYYFFNSQAHRESISPDVAGRLETIYAPYNRKLAEQLTKHGYNDLPSWLSREQVGVGVSLDIRSAEKGLDTVR